MNILNYSFLINGYIANLVSNTLSLRCFQCNSNVNEGCREYDYSSLSQDFMKTCDPNEKACSVNFPKTFS